jgi:hypothetical protein
LPRGRIMMIDAHASGWGLYQLWIGKSLRLFTKVKRRRLPLVISFTAPPRLSGMAGNQRGEWQIRREHSWCVSGCRISMTQANNGQTRLRSNGFGAICFTHPTRTTSSPISSSHRLTPQFGQRLQPEALFLSHSRRSSKCTQSQISCPLTAPIRNSALRLP